ncbi:hypothetical protein MRX96_016558 [Rhipicephalus microplus]
MKGGLLDRRPVEEYRTLNTRNADCIHVQLYRDSKERCKQGPTKASLSLAGCLGLESGFTLDKESHTMALICPDLVLALAFDSRELLIQWQVKIRSNVAEVQQFLVQIWHAPGRAKLASGPARLHLQDHLFCMTSGVPPRLLGSWPLKELRRFGLVDGKILLRGWLQVRKGRRAARAPHQPGRRTSRGLRSSVQGKAGCTQEAPLQGFSHGDAVADVAAASFSGPGVESVQQQRVP